jgi:hypothetical protein
MNSPSQMSRQEPATEAVAIIYAGYVSRGTGVAQHIRQLEKYLPELGYVPVLVSLDKTMPGLRLIPHVLQLVLNWLVPPLGYYVRLVTGRVLLRWSLAKVRRSHLVRGAIFEDVFTAFEPGVPAIAVLHALQSHNLHSVRVSHPRLMRARRYEARYLRHLPIPAITVSEPYRALIASDLAATGGGVPAMSVVPLGLEADGFPLPPKPRPSARLEIVFLGILEPRKNLQFLPQLALYLQGRLEFKITVIGDGPQRGELEGWVRDQGVEHLFEFKGRIAHREIPRALQQFHLMVHPTLTESFAFTLLEGKLAGLWTMASRGITVPEEFCDARLDLDPKAWADYIVAKCDSVVSANDERRSEELRQLRFNYSPRTMVTTYLRAMGLPLKNEGGG